MTQIVEYLEDFLLSESTIQKTFSLFESFKSLPVTFLKMDLVVILTNLSEIFRPTDFKNRLKAAIES